jgi:hypothetical protein
MNVIFGNRIHNTFSNLILAPFTQGRKPCAIGMEPFLGRKNKKETILMVNFKSTA